MTSIIRAPPESLRRGEALRAGRVKSRKRSNSIASSPDITWFTTNEGQANEPRAAPWQGPAPCSHASSRFGGFSGRSSASSVFILSPRMYIRSVWNCIVVQRVLVLASTLASQLSLSSNWPCCPLGARQRPLFVSIPSLLKVTGQSQ